MDSKTKKQFKMGKFIELAERTGGVKRQAVTRTLHLTAKQIDVLAKEAVEGGFIRVYLVPTKTRAYTLYETTGKPLEKVEKVDITHLIYPELYNKKPIVKSEKTSDNSR